jgi:RNA polymerase sigma-70 factor, ECF subfamily
VIAPQKAITDCQGSGHGPIWTVQSSAEPSDDAKRRLVGSPVNFAALYNDHFAFVWRNLRRLGVAEAGLRDAAQDVFMVVHRRLHEFQGAGSVQAWLYSILRRVAADHRRRARRKDIPESEPLEAVADPREPGPESRAAHSEAVQLLLRLLGELDEEKREVLMLVDLEGLSVPEAAQAVGCNLNTAYSRLRAARHAMQEGFERYRAEEWREP